MLRQSVGVYLNKACNVLLIHFVMRHGTILTIYLFLGTGVTQVVTYLHRR